MRVLFLGNNWIGWKVAECVRRHGDDFAGLVLHPENRAQHRREILAAAGVPPETIIEAPSLTEAGTLERIRALGPDIGISASFGYLLRRPLLDLIPGGCLNIHTALLPHNRGAYPNVWSIVDRTPAGVTIHYIDEGVDTGDLVAQHEVEVEPIDTGETLFRKLERAALTLFEATWPQVREGRSGRTPQDRSAGSTHRVRDTAAIDEIDLDRAYTARQLIDILRARTFPPYAGAYFRSGGRKVRLSLSLAYEDDPDPAR